MKNNIKCGNLNVGGTLEALVHSYVRNEPLIIDEPILPFELELVPYDWNIEQFGFNGDVCITKLQLWERLSFLLSVCGYLLFPNNIQNVRRKDKTIVVATKQNYLFEVQYKDLYLFGQHETEEVSIYDWFSVRSGCSHDLDVINTDDDFVSQILFYPSKRSSVPRSNKDAVAISRFNAKDFDEIDHGEGICRLKVLKLMKESGIKGLKNGYDKNGRSLHFALKIEHSHREIKKVNISNDDRIKILLNEPIDKRSDLWKTTQKFLTHQRTSI